MSNNVSNRLLRYAIESAAVAGADQLEAPVEPELAEELNDELAYADKARSEEISRGIALCESLEALADRYGEMEVSVESMDNYQFAVQQVLNASGVQVPASIICASFESAEKDKTSVKEKAKAAIAKIVKWIMEMWNKFISMFTGKTKANKDRAEETQKKAETALLICNDAVKRGEKVVGEKPKAEEKKDEKPAEPKKEEPKGGSTQRIAQLPKWMFSNGRLDGNGALSQIAKMLSTDPDIARDMSLEAAMEWARKNPGKNAHDYFSAHFRDRISSLTPPARISSEDVTIEWHTLDGLIKTYKQASKDAYDQVVHLTGQTSGLIKENNLTDLMNIKEGEDPAKLSEEQKAARAAVGYITARLTYANNYYSVVEGILRGLNSMAYLGQKKAA